MFQVTAVCLRGQYKSRVKTRMVGYIPKVNYRKLRGCMVALRSEANTGHFEDYFKNEAERMDTTGRKVSKVLYDPVVQRYCLYKETKLKGPFLLKSHIQKAVTDGKK